MVTATVTPSCRPSVRGPTVASPGQTASFYRHSAELMDEGWVAEAPGRREGDDPSARHVLPESRLVAGKRWPKRSGAWYRSRRAHEEDSSDSSKGERMRLHRLAPGAPIRGTFRGRFGEGMHAASERGLPTGALARAWLRGSSVSRRPPSLHAVWFGLAERLPRWATIQAFLTVDVRDAARALAATQSSRSSACCRWRSASAPIPRCSRF